MGEAGDVGEPMPERYAELGITGPLRFGVESFISYGLFDSTEPTAHAWLAGTVQRSERRRVELTEQSFVVARVRSTGFEADICLADTGEDPLPGPGEVIAGTVFIVGSIEESPTDSRPGRTSSGASWVVSSDAGDRERRGAHHGGSSGPPHS